MAKQTDPISRIDQIAAGKQARMNEIYNSYTHAKEYEKSDQFKEDRVKALEKIRSILRQGLMEQAEALLMVGRIQQVVLDVFNHENVIVEYEGIKKTLGEMFPK